MALAMKGVAFYQMLRTPLLSIAGLRTTDRRSLIRADRECNEEMARHQPLRTLHCVEYVPHENETAKGKIEDRLPIGR